MKMMSSIVKLLQFTAVAMIAAALKLYYSTTNVDGLKWILAPTAWLVEFVSGTQFAFESNAGYMSGDNTFLIAVSCSGVNFMITAFLMLSLGAVWRGRHEDIGWNFIPIAILSAYLTTILANTIRILTALEIRDLDPEVAGLSREQLHRLEGIVIYFIFLLLLYFISERVAATDKPLITPPTLKRYAFPLALYYATTLAIPFANGAYRQGTGFWEHSIFVIIIPIILILPLAAYGFLRLIRPREQRSSLTQ